MLVAAGLVTHCGNPPLEPPAELAFGGYALVTAIDGFSFFPPLSPEPASLSGAADMSLLPELVVRLERTGPTGEFDILVAAFDATTSPTLRAMTQFERYFVNVPASAYFTEPSSAYRYRVLRSGAEIAVADVPSQIFAYLAKNPGILMGIKFRVAACGAGQELSDGVCVAVCAAGEHRVGGVCAPLCGADEHLVDGACVANTRACAIENGQGVETWTAEGWGPCVVVGCDAGFLVEAGACVPEPLPPNPPFYAPGFTPVSGVDPFVAVSSETITVGGGFRGTKTISVEGPGAPRISVDGAPFVAGPVEVRDGDTLALEVTSADFQQTQTVVVRGTDETGLIWLTEWYVTTRAPLFGLDAVDFVDLVDTNPLALYASSSVTLTGFEGTMTAAAPAGTRISVNGAAFTDGPVTVRPGDGLRLEVTTPAGSQQGLGTYVSLTHALTGWGTAIDWYLTNRIIDQYCDSVVFPPLTNHPLNTDAVFAEVTIGNDCEGPLVVVAAGYDVGYGHVVPGGDLETYTTEYSINGRPWTSAQGTITNGDRIRIRIAARPGLTGTLWYTAMTYPAGVYIGVGGHGTSATTTNQVGGGTVHALLGDAISSDGRSSATVTSTSACLGQPACTVTQPLDIWYYEYRQCWVHPRVVDCSLAGLAQMGIQCSGGGKRIGHVGAANPAGYEMTATAPSLETTISCAP